MIEVHNDLVNADQSDKELVTSLKTRLRTLASSLSVSHQNEVEGIIQGEVEKIDRRFEDVRRNLRKRWGNPTLRKEWVDLIKDMQQKGEKGEAEAAEWVLQTFYEFLQGKIQNPSQREPSNDGYKWGMKRNTITREGIMEVFSRSKVDLVEQQSGRESVHDENESSVLVIETVENAPLIVSGSRSEIELEEMNGKHVNNLSRSLNIGEQQGKVMHTPSHSEVGLLEPLSKGLSQSSRGGDGSLTPNQSGIWPSNRDKDPQFGSMNEGAVSTSASYIFKSDGTMRECPGPSLVVQETPKILEDQNFEVRLEWEIDVVRLSSIPEVGGLPLLVIVHYIIMQTSLNTHLKLDMNRVDNWLRDIEESYLDNPYHNHLHAADVVCSMYYWFTSKFFKENMTSKELLASLMAAAAHDVGHDAVNNRFHIVTRSRLGTRYNDRSPLENYHTCLAFELLYKSDNNWFHSFPLADQSYLRSLIIELIIGTDMSYHQHHQENIIDLINNVELPSSLDEPSLRLRGKDDGKAESKEGSRVKREPCEKVMILKAGLHIADISNPAKPNPICVYWAKRVVQEFFEQGDKEQARGLPISPLCDRNNSSMKEGQKGFIKFVVRPILEPWTKLMPEAQVAMDFLESNLSFWDQQRKNGIFQRESVKQVGQTGLRSRLSVRET